MWLKQESTLNSNEATLILIPRWTLSYLPLTILPLKNNGCDNMNWNRISVQFYNFRKKKSQSSKRRRFERRGRCEWHTWVLQPSLPPTTHAHSKATLGTVREWGLWAGSRVCVRRLTHAVVRVIRVAQHRVHVVHLKQNTSSQLQHNNILILLLLV